jgi:hypothetical protein
VRAQEVASRVHRTNRNAPVITSRGDQRSSGRSMKTAGHSAGTVSISMASG